MVWLFQDGQKYQTDEGTLRQWLWEKRIRTSAQVNFGNAWQPVTDFPDCIQFLTDPLPPAPKPDWLKIMNVATTIAGVGTAAYLTSRLFESEKKSRTAGKTKRTLFLSFDHDDKEQVDGFRLLAFNKNVDLEFRDGSLRRAIESRDANYIQQKLREQMDGCSVCVCLIGSNTWKSDWVDWEVRTCVEEGRGVLGIHLKDRSGVIPAVLGRVKAAVVGWEPHEFGGAIEKAAQAVGR